MTEPEGTDSYMFGGEGDGMGEMRVNNMTRKEFDTLPHRESWDEEAVCDSIIILPGRIKNMHDSGYRCMDFVAVSDGKPVCRLSGCSDVVHIEGIGGYGNWSAANGVPKSVAPSGWNIDCLPKSGLLQMFPSSRRIKVGGAYSSFEVYAIERKDNG